MIFYNYEALWLLSHGDPKLLMEYFWESDTMDIPKPDFIVNPKALVDAFWLTDRHKAEYLGICALRNYEDYKMRGDTGIDLDLIPPWVPIEVIKDNPLAKLTETKIELIKE